MSKTSCQVITGEQFQKLLFEIVDSPLRRRKHAILVERNRAEKALKEGRLREGWTATFYDDDDTIEGSEYAAYCFAKVRADQFVVTHKTYEVMPAAPGVN